jgi:hypothetical protein
MTMKRTAWAMLLTAAAPLALGHAALAQTAPANAPTSSTESAAPTQTAPAPRGGLAAEDLGGPGRPRRHAHVGTA